MSKRNKKDRNQKSIEIIKFLTATILLARAVIDLTSKILQMLKK